MDKSAARKIIQDTFQNPFDKDRFYRFTKELLNRFDDAPFVYRGNYIPDAYEPYIQALERIGKYKDPDGKKIDLLVVRLKKESSLEHARTMQRNFVAWYLNGSRGGELKDAALVAFVSPGVDDWRFSLVQMDYQLVETPTGRVKVKEAFTAARRYSFLVGKNESTHTAQSRLVPIIEDDTHNPTLAVLEDAFNIETVTREFFEKYRELYLCVKETLERVLKRDAAVRADFTAKGVSTVDFAKKLLGQIVFLYFLQRKGWFGVKRKQAWGSGSKHFLRELFDKRHGVYNNFFNDILEPLFYEALGSEHRDDYYSRFDCRIPFLNGGLFDPIGDYDWVNTDLVLPNDLFANRAKTPEGDIGDGVLDVFDRYNFTVKEDEPLEKEVAVDPEMLGKVFENLLEVKDRKSKGTYYTPREIVHFMCVESLIDYLTSELKGRVSEAAIRTLISYGETAVEHDAQVARSGRETATYSYRLPVEIRENAVIIDNKLARIRICDPAVGSGAFPVGMMSEIVRARTALNPYLDGQTSRSPYDFKRHAVQNSLYGVDIDPSAIEIAKLRLWLSLVVDEEERAVIQPLPNLDYKIVLGNSLTGVAKNLFNQRLFSRLEELKPAYFNETRANKKQQYRAEIDDLIRQLTDGHRTFDFELYFSEVFHENGGFNVVIANPPYVKEYVNRSAFDGVRESPCYQGKMDLWYLFACKGLDIAQKERGMVTFIAQNNWVTSSGASKMRAKVIRDAQIVKLIDFGSFRIFEAGIQTMVMIFRNNKEIDNYRFDYRRLHGDSARMGDVLALLRRDANPYAEYLTPTINREALSNKTLTFSDSTAEALLNKLEATGQLRLAPEEVAQGIVPNPDVVGAANLKKLAPGKVAANGIKIGDGVFVVPNGFFKQLSQYERNLLRPLYEPTDLGRFVIRNEHSREIIYTTKRTDAERMPHLLEHLAKFKEIMEDRRENQDGRLKYYQLHWPRDGRFFETGAKILGVRKCARPTFVYTDREAYVMMAVNVIRTNRFNLKYLVGILNSTLITFWLRNRGKMQGTNYQIDKEPLMAIPIAMARKAEQDELVSLVTAVMKAASNGDDLRTRECEEQIDRLVYRIYGLTADDVELIEKALSEYTEVPESATIS